MKIDTVGLVLAKSVFQGQGADVGSFARAHLLHDAFAAEPLVAQFPQTMVRSQGIAPGRLLRVRLPAERLRVFGREAPHG